MMMRAMGISGAVCTSKPPAAHPHARKVALLLIVSLALSACNEKSEIKVYRIVRPEGDKTGFSHISGISDPSTAETPPVASALAPVSGTVPRNWEPQPLAEMRQASYLVKGENGAVADISLVRLGGGAGGTLDNVNRWLSQ